jgi:ferrous iron transport protein B
VKKIKIAVAGNPNVGKSTLFNVITGTNQHVGNYPGVTVERKEGKVDFKGYELIVTDLPGIYSMNAFSPEEVVSRDFIAEEKPDVIINIVDASNLEKNLYLTLQILEMKVPVVLFLNMTDKAEKRGFKVDPQKLSKEIETAVVAGVAREKTGISDLLEKCIDIFEKKPEPVHVPYSGKVSGYIEKIKTILALEKQDLSEDWRAIRFIEGSDIDRKSLSDTTLEKIDGIIKELVLSTGHKIHSMIMVQERYALIKNVVRKSSVSDQSVRDSLSEKIDKFVLHPLFSMPVFLLTLFLLFQTVFFIGQPLEELFSVFFEFLGDFAGSFWADGSDSIIRDLLVEGIIGGVGGVLVFAPYIFLVFVAISILEDSGYMARVAVIMDKWMSKIGLSGKSFMPMILGFGCTVPAIMGARIIENKFERLATIMVTPFMSCGARLPVYLLLISAFIPLKFQALTLLAIYMTGVIFAIVFAKLLRLTVFKGEENPLIVELPSYSKPSIRSIWILTWSRGKHFLEKAGTLILFASIVLWVLNTFPKADTDSFPDITEQEAAMVQAEYSFSGRIGKTLEPAFEIMGGDWKVASAFLASLAAKELFISQISILFAMGADESEEEEGSLLLQQKFKENYSLGTAIAIILFILLAAPCIATFAAVKIETNSWFWPTVQYAGMTAIAYIAAIIGYLIFS